MLIQPYIIDAAKSIISSSLASNGVTGWTVYGQFDNTDKGGVRYPHIRVNCWDEEPMNRGTKDGLRKSKLEIVLLAVRLLNGSGNSGTTSTEFKTVSDYVLLPFFRNDIETTFGNASNNLDVRQVTEDSSETTPLSDGWFMSQKLDVYAARTS